MTHVANPATPPRYAPNARHQEGARSSGLRLALKLFLTLRWWYLPMLLSDYGRMILRRKYDAVATDHAYHGKPSGRLVVGRWIDAMILRMPIHAALRQRLRAVVDDLKAETRLAAERTQGDVRVLSAPCGLSRDVVTTVEELRKESPATAARLDLHGLDLDATNEALPISRARAEAAGIAIKLHQEDLFDSRGLDEALATRGRFHVVNCIGLTAWVDLPEVTKLAARFRGITEKDGALVVDNWHEHSTSHMGRLMEINTRYHDPDAFVAAIERAGWRLARGTRTENGVVDVYVFRAC